MATDFYWLREFEGLRLAFMARQRAGERLADEISDPLLVTGDRHMLLMPLP